MMDDQRVRRQGNEPCSEQEADNAMNSNRNENPLPLPRLVQATNHITSGNEDTCQLPIPRWAQDSVSDEKGRKSNPPNLYLKQDSVSDEKWRKSNPPNLYLKQDSVSDEKGRKSNPPNLYLKQDSVPDEKGQMSNPPNLYLKQGDNIQERNRKGNEGRMTSKTKNASKEKATFHPRKLNQKEKMLEETLIFGKVVSIIPEKQIGFIKANNHKESLQKDVFFSFHKVRNIATQVAHLSINATVRYCIDQNGNLNKPNAVLVILDKEHCTPVKDKEGHKEDAKESKTNSSGREWKYGVIISANKFIFVKDSEGNRVFLHPDKISKFILPFQQNDKVQFILNERQEEKLSALRAKRYKLALGRSTEELQHYFEILIQHLESASSCVRALQEVSNDKSQWEFIAKHIPENHAQHYCKSLLCLMECLVSMKGEHLSYLVGSILTILLQAIAFKEIVPDDVLFHRASNLCIKLITRIPKLAIRVKSIVDVLQKTEDPERLRKVMKDIVDQCFCTLSKINGLQDKSKWNELSEMPFEEELNGNLISEDSCLRPVHLSEPYISADDYIDVYYRLLRAEAFTSIQLGIKQLKTGKLDERDMNVYFNVRYSGIYSGRDLTAIVIQFQTTTKVANWEKSMKLMTGNLLCLSPSQAFSNVIWATVSRRDTELLKKSSMITIEICPFNKLSFIDIIMTLEKNAGQTIMVESPMFYKSVGPVLNSLQSFDIEKFILAKEVVSATSMGDPPKYIEPYLTRSTQCYGEDSPGRSSQSSYDSSDDEDDLASFGITVDRITKSLDSSQRVAFIHALKSRLAVIQGPPGCGKTYVGVKIVEAILKCNLNCPILVMTYKNHALDEFLKHAMKFCAIDKIVRLGGRSQDEQLKACSIQESMKEKVEMDKEYLNNLFDNRNMIEELSEEVTEISKKLNECSVLTDIILLSSLTEIQLQSLLLDANWNAMKYKRKKKRFASRDWILGEVLPHVLERHSSLEQFLKVVTQDKSQLSELENHCRDLLLYATQAWFPNKEQLRQIKILMEKYRRTFVQKTDELPSSGEAASMDDDEEDVKKMIENRSSLLGKDTFNQGHLTILEKKQSSNSFEMSDFPAGIVEDHGFLHVTNLWMLDDNGRYRFIFNTIHSLQEELALQFQQVIEELEEQYKKKNLLNIEKKLAILHSKSIIGVTITGASINNELLQQLRPSVVLVEEAAEILEPSLLAALQEDVEHLILIGDHKQLRPQVNTYSLIKDYHFDISMMERLVSSKFPYKVLSTQSRMRPEFSKLLRDIYPYLKDNLSIVHSNTVLPSMEKSMFFWDHTNKEEAKVWSNEQNRSTTNKKEAEMVIALVLYLLKSGCCPSKITVLAAYLGQVRVLRAMMKEKQSNDKYLDLFGGKNVDIQTIDMFQGDENDIIIVSLVRSNAGGILGFVNTLNRRCVAQSRAKCGMYIAGAVKTITGMEKASSWQPLLQHLDKEGCLGDSIGIQCVKHKEKSVLKVNNAATLMTVVDNLVPLCKLPCGDLFPCHNPDHACLKPCHPPHAHRTCYRTVQFHHGCGHADTRKCYETESSIKCTTKVDYKYPNCGHLIRKCCSDKAFLPCSKMCAASMLHCKHPCQEKCGSQHQHKICKVPNIKFVFARCGHEGAKECYERKKDLTCKQLVDKKLRTCKHSVKDECWKEATDVTCNHLCEEKMICGFHKCKKKCGEAHNHDYCNAMTSYSFAECGHESPHRKECSATITWKCKSMVSDKASCGHAVRRECCQSSDSVQCEFPCQKQLGCGHPCLNKCGEACTKTDCRACVEAFTREFTETARKRALDLKSKIANLDGGDSFIRKELHNGGHTKAEYMKVKDQVDKYILPMHNWSPKVTKVERVTNMKLELNFEKAKQNAFGYLVAEKFHGTSDDGVKGIIKEGFRMPGPPKFGQKPGMYGQGIYFATDSSKSAQGIYTKNSNKLLLCEVLLGKSKIVEKADNSLCEKKLKKEKFDSVYAPRGTEVKNDEFIVYNPDQAVPRYIIHFQEGNTAGRPQTAAPTSSHALQKIRLNQQKRVYDQQDFECVQYRIAEGHFLTMSKRRVQAGYKHSKDIAYIEFVCNEKLEDQFKATKINFAKNSVPDHEILAFHATADGNVDSILKKNLDSSKKMAHGRVHGNGNYFSEFPDFSLRYGNALILFRVLPGREYQGSNTDYPSTYHSKKVNADKDGCGEQLVVKDPAQFVPYFVYHLK